MYDDYGMTDEMIDEMDDQAFWQQVENEEERKFFDKAREQQEDDWQAILDNDPDYHKWADDLDRLAERDREILDLAMIEDERNYRTLQPWD